MERRQYLIGMAGVLGGLSGDIGTRTGAVQVGDAPADASSPSLSATGADRPAFGSVSLPVERSQLTRAAPRDAIPAITDPAFADDWSGTGRTLAGDDLVVGVARDGEARAYPLATLSTHEVVNDAFAGPLVVTYCPLCASGVVARRRVRGESTVFGVSGFLFRSDLVMYDRRTRSLWSQLMATSIRGPAMGERLALVPSTLATWENWSASHPETRVLLPPPASGTLSRMTDSLAGGRSHGHVGAVVAETNFDDDRLPRRELVVGVAAGGAATAYPRAAVADAGVVNDWVGDRPVVLADRSMPFVYDRRVDGTVLSFARDGDRLRGGGSTWSIATGEALSGPHEGRSLVRVPGATTVFWFAWLAFHPETTVYGL